MQTRRQALQLVAATCFVSWSPNHADATSLANVLNIAKLIGDAADGMAKLGDSVAHLIHLGSQGFDEINARKVRAKLIQISAELSAMFVGQTGIIASLENYRAKWWPPHSGQPQASIPQQQQDHWNAVLRSIVGQLSSVEETLTLVAQDRSDFVLQDSYRQLRAALMTREGLLSDLSDDPPPTSRAEFRALDKAIQQYHRLHRELDRCIDAFNRYVASLPR